MDDMIHWKLRTEADCHNDGRMVIVGGICEDDIVRIDRLRRGCKHVVRGTPVRVPGGGAANVAWTLKQLNKNVSVDLLAHIGVDAVGARVSSRLRDGGVELPLAPLAGFDTSVSYIATENDGTGTILSVIGARGVPIPLDDRLIAAAPRKSPGEIQIWSASGEKLHTIGGFDGSVYSMAFSANGRRLASGMSDTTVLIWSLPGTD